MIRPRTAFLTWLVALAMCSSNPLSAAETLRVGFAAKDITPPKGQRMAGYYADRFNTGTKDPLFAKAIVFEQGETRLAFVACDLIGVPREITAEARKSVAAETGIPVESIAISATHSHTGPLLEGPYREGLANLIAAAAIAANQALAPATLSAGSADESRISFVRRFRMKSGPVRFNPGLKNPDIIEPTATIDPAVTTLAIAAAGDAKPKALLTVFALHLDTVGGTEYSADYPFVLERELERKRGDLFSVFAAGTCGDINHIDVKADSVRKTAEIGKLLAETAERALAASRPITAPRLAAKSRTIRAPLQPKDPASVVGTPQDVSKIETPDRGFLKTVQDEKYRRIREFPGDSYAVEVQAFRLSEDVALVFLPGEVFVDLGKAVKSRSPFRTTIVIELANDSNPHYIPTKKAFSEGSYETINSFLAPGAGELLVDAAADLLKELKAR